MQDKLQSFIQEQILERSSTTTVIAPDDPLLEWGVLDSLSLTRLLAFIRDELGVEIPPEEVVGEHFRDLHSITRLVTRLKGD